MMTDLTKINSGCDIEDVELIESCFYNLPEELFLHICSFLDFRDIILGLSKVCKKFNEILQQDSIFRAWIAARWHRPYLTCDSEDVIDWKVICFQLERDIQYALQDKKSLENSVTHISNVDSVLFVDNGETCLTGCRDRNIAIWKFSPEPAVSHTLEAHEGWVWRLLQCGGHVYSASWDTFIKQWAYHQDLVATNTYRCSSPVLSIASNESGVIYGGCYNRSLKAFDPRSASSEPLFTTVAHKSAVLTLSALGDHLVTAGEDKSIALWDTRTRKLICRCTLPESGRYATCSQVLGNTLYVGDKSGAINLYSIKSSELHLEHSFNLHSSGICGIKVCDGAIWTASVDGMVKCHAKLKPFLPIWATKEKEVSGMDYHNGRLVVGTSQTVAFWWPHEDEE